MKINEMNANAACRVAAASFAMGPAVECDSFWEDCFTALAAAAKARLAWLEKEMEQEKREKLLDLVQRMMKVVGRITDAGHLSIGPKGDINGYIQGTEGKASVETIGAGGYNVQCYHFRTLIHEI